MAGSGAGGCGSGSGSVVGDFADGISRRSGLGDMFNGLGDYAGEVAGGAQAAWDHAEENDAQYRSGDIEGAKADLAFRDGFAQRSNSAEC